ncbi:MAG: hypothetical protein GXY40_07115 [Syntrophomonadaceae bacterium]|nr:hypothetical protein [Syntrophomonadaceae bacterium]
MDNHRSLPFVIRGPRLLAIYYGQSCIHYLLAALDRLYQVYLLNSRIARCFCQTNPVYSQGSSFWRMLKRMSLWINRASGDWAGQWIESSRLCVFARNLSRPAQGRPLRLLGYFGVAFFFADVVLRLLLQPGLTLGLLGSIVMLLFFLLLTTVGCNWQQIWSGSIISRVINWICDFDGEEHI